MNSGMNTCHTCGLTQVVPEVPKDYRALCCRCQHPFRTQSSNHHNQWSAALALTALILYPAGILLPMMRIERFGHMKEDSLLSGVVSMISEGYYFIGIVVLLFSIVLPPVKLLVLWGLATTQSSARGGKHRGIIYRMVEFLGKWSMLDVMLVALMLAFVKLGDVVEIHAGSGVIAFTLMVCLSLIAGLVFNPYQMWENENHVHAQS